VADVDIGTLAGKVALEDKTTATVDLILSKVTALEQKFSDGLNPSVVKAAEGFVVAEGAIRLFDKAVELAVDVVKDLTTEGSKIGSIEDNFDHLTSSAGRLGSTLIGELRAGTHGTISDLELIKTANADLAAGVDLTDKQFRTMANGAFALAQAKGLDVKTALDDVNDAMLKGQARGITYLTGRIDIEAAEDKFAASLGTTADRLNEEGKAQAGRIAILDAVSKATGRLGEQNDGLGEIIDQIETKWDNLYNQLAKTVGTSPSVVRAFETVRDSLVKAFGGDSQNLIGTVAGWVNYLADKVTQYAPVVIDGFIKIKGWISDTIKTVKDEWDTVPSWLKATAADSLIAAAGFMTLNAGMKAASGGSFDLISTLGNLSTFLHDMPEVIVKATGALGLLKGLAGLDFSSLAMARVSLNLMGGAALALVGPLGAVAIASAALFAAWEIGHTQPVLDFWEKVGLRIKGYTGAQADAIIAGEHQFTALKAQEAASKAQANALAQAKAMMESLTQTTHASSAATDHNTEIHDKNKFIINQTREEIKKLADARKALASVDEDWHVTVDALDQAVVASIKHYLEAGVAQDKLATAYHLTAEQVAAVAKSLKDQTEAEKIAERAASDSEKRWEDLYGLRLTMSGKTTDAMIADIARWKAAEIRAHVDAKTDTTDFYSWLAQMESARTESMTQNRLRDNNNSKAYWDDQKAQAEDAYDFALAHADQFTQGYIEQLRQTKIAATDAAEHWQNNVGKTLDELTHQADKLGQALRVVFTMDVTAQNLEQTLKGMHPNNNPLMGDFGGSYSRAVELAKKGYSFQEIMNFLNGQTLPEVPIGPRIPGFRDGGVGDFGAGTIVELHGKEAIIPLDGHSGGMGTVHNTFYVNGTAEEAAEKISDIMMRKAFFGRPVMRAIG
jgi:hypothetical protein